MCLCLHLDDHVASTTLYCTLSGECAVHGLVYVNAVTLSSPGVYFDRFSSKVQRYQCDDAYNGTPTAACGFDSRLPTGLGGWRADH